MDINNLWSGYDLNSKKQNTRCLAVNTILEGKYLVGPVIGQGGFGITYVGYDLNMETKIAIKEYFPVELVSRDTTTMHGDRVLSLSGEKSLTYKDGLKKYVAEAQNVSQFSEIPGVVSVKDFFYANETAYIVMEYIDGISLKDYLKEKGGRLLEEETLKIMRPILDALVQVHRSGIIHRDISPDNIMLTFAGSTDTKSGESKGAGNAGQNPSGTVIANVGGRKITSVKLIDFGAARMTAKNDQKSLTIILKHGYAPEEQYRTHGEQGPWTDVYALCAVLYRMLTGETPVPAMDRMFKDELKTPEQCGAKVSTNTSVAIMKGLAVKKDDRIPSVQELIHVMYEGGKVKKALEKKMNRTALAACTGIAAALAIGGMVFFGKNGIVGSSMEKSAPESGMLAASGDENRKGTSKTDDSSNIPAQMVDMDVNQNDDAIGEQIVWPDELTMIAAGDYHVLSLREDGTVWAAGNNDNGQCELEEWDHIARVYAYGYISAGLRTDGTVVLAGDDEMKDGVSSWTDIVDLALSYNHILGLTKEGKVVSVGNNEQGQCETGDWENIEYINASRQCSFGMTGDGGVLVAGYDEMYEEALEKVQQWHNVKQIAVDVQAPQIAGLTEEGTVLYAGEWTENNMDVLESLEDVEYLTINYSDLVCLKKDGTIYKWNLERTKEQEINWNTDDNTNDFAALTLTANSDIALKKDGSIVVSADEDKSKIEIDDILQMENIDQAIWANDILAVLDKDSRIHTVGFRIQHSVQNRAEHLNSTDCTKIRKLVNDNGYLAAVLNDGTIVRDDKTYITTGYGDVHLEPNVAEEHKDQTPRLYQNWEHVVDLSVSDTVMAALFEDGTVKAAGLPENQVMTDYKTGLTMDGSCEVDNWKDVKQVLAQYGRTIGLKNDGTLYCTDPEIEEEWKAFTDIQSIWGNINYCIGIRKDGTAANLRIFDGNGSGNTAGWTDLVQIAVSNDHVAGLKADGTVVATGSNFFGQCNVEAWTDVVSISAGDTATIGLTSDGRVLMAGAFLNDYYQAEKWEPVDIQEALKAE